MNTKREHFGACNVKRSGWINCGFCDSCRFYLGAGPCGDASPGMVWSGSYPTMEGAIEALDPFQTGRP